LPCSSNPQGEISDRDALVDGFEKIRNYDTKGICGVIGFSPTDHKSIEERRFYKPDIEKKVLIHIAVWRRVKD